MSPIEKRALPILQLINPRLWIASACLHLFLLAKASQVRFSVMPIGYFIISCFDLQIYFILMIRTNILLISFIKKKMCIFDIR